MWKRFFDQLMQQESLKWLALIAMVVDHVSEHLLDGYQPGRAIGRLAFPLFAMFTAYSYTRYYQPRFPGRYIARLLLFGVLAQAAYFTFGLERLNIMVTLALGLLVMFLYYNKKYTLMIPLTVGIALFNHYVYSIEYGLPGVLLPLFLSLENKTLVLIPAIFLTARPPLPYQDSLALSILLPSAYHSEAHTMLFETAFAATIFFAAASYTYLRPAGKGAPSKYFFYAFYPAHLALILALQRSLSS